MNRRAACASLRALSGLLLTAVLFAAPRMAGAALLPGFQIEVDALGALPSGSYSGSRASDVFDAGPGFALTASIGIRNNLFFAVRSGAMYHKGFETVPSQSWAQPAAPGTTRATAIIYEAVYHRRLTTIPTLFLLQYRYPVRSGVAVHGEGGVGLMSFAENVRLQSTQDSINETDGRQTGFAYQVGVGISFGIAHDLELVAGGDFQQSRTSAGEVWGSGDNPQFLTGSIGLRYPRY
jgi:hypothetical protein